MSAGVQDAEDFGETIAALKYLKFSLEEISHMVQTLAVILHVGNLRLTEDGEEVRRVGLYTKERSQSMSGRTFIWGRRLLGFQKMAGHSILVRF